MSVRCVKEEGMAIVSCSCLLTRIEEEGCSETSLFTMPLKCVKRRMVASVC